MMSDTTNVCDALLLCAVHNTRGVFGKNRLDMTYIGRNKVNEKIKKIQHKH